MSFLLDLIIIAIIALTIYFAAKNGFVKTAISATSFILAIVITAMFASPLAERLKETSIAERIETATCEAISDSLRNSSTGIDGLINGDSEKFNALLEFARIERADIESWYSENIVGTDGEMLLASRIAEPIIDVAAMLVAIIILFICSQIALAIVAFLLDKIMSLPVLRTANKGLGIALGAVLALFRVLLFCFIMNFAINHAFLDNSFISSLEPDNTLLFKFFSEIDVFSFFM